MHEVYKIKGFIFKKEDNGEADRVFSVFTKEFGRMEIFAKSIRVIASKLKSGIDIFLLSELSFIQGKNRKTLTDAVALKKFNHIDKNPEKMEIAYNVCDMLDNFIKGQEPDEKVWELIIDFFEKLNTCQLSATNYLLIYYYFFWNFISVLGYKPELSKCAHCNQKLNPETLYFSNKEGGIICKSCLQLNKGVKKINSDIVKTLRLILKNDWHTIMKLKIELSSQKLLKDISNEYCNYVSYSFKNNLLKN